MVTLKHPGFLGGLRQTRDGSLKEDEYVLNPAQKWWNPDVATAFAPTALLTGQVSVNGLLNAMDAAWKKGPS